MTDVLNFEFFKREMETGVSKTLVNDSYTLLVVQIEGQFDALDIVVEGRVQADTGEWVSIAGMSVSDLSGAVEYVSASGVYQYPIEGIREIRLNLRSITNGWVTASGVVYDSAEGLTAPQPISQSIKFGNTSLFVKGAAEQIFFDPATGNIVGYDRTATDCATTTSVNLTEVTGGIGNKLIQVLPDTARISGTYTAQAFSLQTRAAIMGGNVAYDAVSTMCEKIKSTSETLTIAGNPAPAPGENATDAAYWCFVSKIGGNTRGTNYGVDPVTKQVQGFFAEVGKIYEVTYYAHKTSARSLAVPSQWNPVMMTVQIRFAVYARQGYGDAQGVRAGWLIFVAPRCILNADAGIDGTQTGNATTGGSWLALSTRGENLPQVNCADGKAPCAYYVYVPCENPNDGVFDVVSVGEGLTLGAGQTEQLPIKLVMGDDQLVQPDFATLGYYSENEAVAMVSNKGIVTGVSAGETFIRTFLNKSTGAQITCRTRVVVTNTRSVLRANRGNIRVV